MNLASGRLGGWRLRAVGLFAVLWTGLGCLDYTMTQIQGDAWLARMEPTESQMAWFHGMPAWTDAAWAISVWAGLLGGVLLLLRLRWATPVFAASFLGWLLGAVYTVALSSGIEAMGPYWPIVIVKGALCLFFVWYARVMTRNGVLR